MRRVYAVLIIVMFVCGVVTPGYAFYDGDFYGDFLLASSKKKISMDLEGASLVDVLKVLSQQTGLSFVSAQSVTDRRLTLYLEKVPLKEAMDTIFKANDLVYEFYPESNIFIIKEAVVPEVMMETRVYKLKHALVPGGRLATVIEDMSGSSGSGGSSSSGQNTEEEGNILEAIRDVLSEYGSVNEDPRTNSLVVRDVAASFPSIERVIALLDVPLPKVLIEVEVLDVSKDLADRLGLNISDGLVASLGVLAGGENAVAARTTTFPFKLLGNRSGTIPDSTVTPGQILVGGFTATLEMLRSDASTRFLARPKILTLSGQTAEINLVSNEAVNASSSLDSDSNSLTIEVERQDVGTKLRVTPQVDLDGGEVVMIVEPEVSSAVNDVDLDNLARGYGLVIKKVQRRESKSVVRIKDYETLMVGGLLTKKAVESNTRVPFFGSIPLLGKAFRHSAVTEEDRELLVFITPKIVREDGALVAATENISFVSREQTPGDRKRVIDQAMARFE
ncbi:MAG: type II secretion system protein GspD [Desulfobulbus sp.]|nr:type II secretion system protein GspD [Desulfobulbus sp.]